MKAAHFTTVLLSLAPIASAYAWPEWLPELDALVVRRQDSDSTTSSAKATATASATDDPADAGNLNTAGITSASDSGTASATGDSSASATGTATGTDKDASSTSKKSSKTTSASVNADDPAGSAVMLTPQTTLTSALYRIGEYVTMGWNYTNVQVTPTAVDLVISCTTASESWTLTSNMTYETSAAFTWDTGAFQSDSVQQPLLVEQYILYIYDADASISATAGPGELTAAAAMTFGLYTGQPYTPLASGWVCATCNSGAMSSSERQALGFLFTVAAITVASFTWFVTGLW
ncbi:hypothetical protein J7T55_009072 [Diaporthe amygdali]|uniref:uncharacterized protein n=1 Tax=Phomopsis amygdali TaxID=1214568 RepID=UPI0022FF3CFA|nr:uncharacterized protein J7T55_009072 [Diaporthe amygdali]KAJ0118289.1 hypothetical protein J7T55_009072 [Diaporthe amygdali]